MKTNLRLPFVLLGAVVAAPFALAQAPRDQRPSAVNDLPAVVPPAVVIEERRVVPELDRTDRNFVEKAARMAMDDMKISRVAAERTTNREVRALAEAMIADYNRIVEDVSRIAAERRISLPAKELKDDAWVKKGADNFDRDYLDKMVSDYEDTVKAFDHEARNGDDPQTVAFARKHLATLQGHLFLALDLKKMLR